MQNKCHEQNILLYVLFIEFNKAFIMLSREILWTELKKFEGSDGGGGGSGDDNDNKTTVTTKTAQTTKTTMNQIRGKKTTITNK